MPTCARCQRELPEGALYCAYCATPVLVTPRSAADPYIGRTFRGVYHVQQRIGGGGMGQVYKALHVTLDVPVALKILKKALLADPSVVQRFQREARAASRLRHPNIVAVTDFGQDADGTLFMAMEYVEGRSLARLVAEDRPIAEERIVHIGAQILSALSESHGAATLHRDLKPENVMVEERRGARDVVKVLDFGIAKIQAQGVAASLTQDGLVCGTPGYMSPEQWRGAGLDARSDLYAVGVILYELVAGRRPFDAATPLEMLRRHLTERPPLPGAHGAQVSPDLESCIMRALSPDPAGRASSADEMRRELLACRLTGSGAGAGGATRPTAPLLAPAAPSIADEPPGTTGPLPATPAPDGRGTSQRPVRARRGALAAAILLALAIAAYLASTRSSTATRPAQASAPTATASPIPTSTATPAATATPTVTSTATPVSTPTSTTAPGPTSTAPPLPASATPEARSTPTRVRGPAAPPQPTAPFPVAVRGVLDGIATPAATSGDGVLSVQADPFAEVFLDGRPYGETPREFRLPAGAYRLRAVHPQLGAREARVEVKAGQRVRWTAEFVPPDPGR